MSASYDKRCSKCGETKNVGDFNKQSSSRDGLKAWCRECCRAHKADWDANNRERIRAYSQFYGELHSEEIRAKSIQRYHDREKFDPDYRERNKLRSEKWRQDHPNANREYIADHWNRLRSLARARYKANAERYRLLGREISGRSRANKANNHVVKIDYGAIVERDNYVCHICRKSIAPGTHEFDHVIPISKGGPHTMENVKMAHAFCNRSKKDKLAIEDKTGKALLK